MKIEEFVSPDEQMCVLGNHHWSVARLIRLARDLPVMTVPLDHLNVYYRYEKLTLRDMVMHLKAVYAADLTRPIILDEDGELMDGRHRIMKAMFFQHASIAAVRFQKNPSPDKVTED